ncbi:BEN domain-containing protein 5-like isoform X8 [Dermacentor silvarum]|uniref:BEN domain-containing protein 5-like isoform X6 n=1 Tax=Dermacentor silvarum TaxID=543639 RepID=UPI002101084B|nr:BEN domain-containing protein 5-like isoform X6 [Dermacentor silvarum]XP_049524387.1 BEN domain-containing protein 5-like isoform X7 [Dermacentor silvarum]XP_049524388.1 BEN domain-containing protein 5-like isoform X8 [Dermacentor silvarum]
MATSGTPSFAFVKYHDGAKAIVHISLIKKYAPTSVNELCKKKLVYWCDTGLLSDHNDEDYYLADIVELGVTKADLIQRLTKRKISVPEFIFDGDSSATSGLATNSQVPSAKKAARNVQAAKRRNVARLMSDDQGTSSDDGEDDVVPKKLLLAEQQKNAALCRKLAALRKEKDELQARHDRLEDHFLNKLDSWFTATCQRCCKENSVPCPNATPPNVGADDSGAAVLASQSSEESDVAVPGASIMLQPANPPSQAVCNQESDIALPAVFAEVNGKVHLGNGVFVDKERWDLLQVRGRDSLFCKELAKLVWGVPALRGRSVTGALCRRFLKETNAVEKPASSPHKLQAVGNAFDAYLRRCAPEEEKKLRRSKMNRYLADMLRELK